MELAAFSSNRQEHNYKSPTILPQITNTTLFFPNFRLVLNSQSSTQDIIFFNSISKVLDIPQLSPPSMFTNFFIHITHAIQ
jgi:hypothetical protein